MRWKWKVRAAVEALAIYKQIRTGPHRVVKVAHAPATDRDITSRSTGLAVTNFDNCACARRNRCLHWHTLGRAPSATGWDMAIGRPLCRNYAHLLRLMRLCSIYSAEGKIELVISHLCQYERLILICVPITFCFFLNNSTFVTITPIHT